MYINSHFPNKKLIAFDLDGTLIDSMPWYAEIATQLLVKYYSLSALQAQQAYYHTSGIPFVKQLDELFPEHIAHLNKEVAQLFEQQKSTYIQEQGFPLTSEVCQTLQNLQTKGVKIAISSSNAPENLTVSAQRWPVQFDAVLGYENELFQKGLSHFRWLADHFQLNLADILFVGDSLDDYRLAQAAGVDFIARLGSFTAEDFYQLNSTIICIPDIPSILI